MEYLFPEMYEGEAQNTAKRTIQYPAGAEQYPELVRILDDIYDAGKNLKQSEDTWTKFVPVFDQGQKWFSRRSEEHVKLPKGLTWTRIKDWAIDIFNLRIGRRQFERRLRAHREIGNQPEKKPATVKTKKNTAKALACADAIVVAYRAGQDISELVEAYERARSGDGVPPDQGPTSTGAVVTTNKQNPAAAVIGVTAGPSRVGSATKTGSQPKSSISPSEPISRSAQHANVLPVPRVATATPARSTARPRPGSSIERNARVVLFKKSALIVGPELGPKPRHPLGDWCLHSLRGAETGDGYWEFDPERLYELLGLVLAQRILVSDTYDLFNDQVGIDVVLEHLRVFAAVPWLFVSVLTGNTQRLGQIQSALNSQRLSWPRNLEVGLTVVSTTDLAKKLKVLGLYRIEHKWISFLPFESSEVHPVSLECPSLPSAIEQAGRPRIVVGGRIDRQSGRSTLSVADAKFLVDSAKSAGSKVFYCPESAKLAFERGDAEAQIANEINLDQRAVKGAISELDKYRELPDFRFAPVGKVQNFARNYDSVQRLKPVHHALSRFDLMCGPALQP